MSKGRWLARRLAHLLLVTLGVIAIVFFLVRLLPGEPARSLMGIRITPEVITEFHEKWGLDEPLWSQFLLFMKRLFQGNLGESLLLRQPVTEVVLRRAEPTLWLVILGSLMSLVIAVPIAIAAAVRKDSMTDHLARAVPLAGFAMPPPWVGIMLILIFSLNLGVFPVGGFGGGFSGHLRSMILPSVTAALIMAPILIRSLRQSLIDALEEDYIDTARSKGLSERRVIVRHALRNASISSVTVLGLNIGILIGSTVVIERVFAIPGVGALLVEGALNRDFPVVQGTALSLSLAVLLVYLLTDLALLWLDPRVTE